MSDLSAVDVTIMGREFSVACSESERESLIDAVNYLNNKLDEIQDKGRVVGGERIAMMVALNLAHELLTLKNGDVDVGDLKRRVNNLQGQIDHELSKQDNLF
jgi:cell division protein ZapA